MHIKNIHGVTLIELLMAVAIIAVISAIAIPMYSNYIQTSRTAEGWNGLASLKLAQEEFFLENNRYFPDPDGNASTTAGTLSTWWIPDEDNDGDNSDRNFSYTVTSSNTGTNYVITATGRGAGFDVPASVSFSLSN